jgi:tetratricopeptide (TPR) repeat protein
VSPPADGRGRDRARGDGRHSDGPRRDGGRRDGPRSDAPARDSSHRPRVVEPELPEHITADQVDRSVHRELRTLSKDNAHGVARHLAATAEAMVEEDLDRALAHAQNASRRAGRVPVVRETLGLVHYRRGEWAKALAEFRTARRLSGSDHLLPLIADTERGLGRPARAVEIATSPEAQRLPTAERMELAVVMSGARRDLGQAQAAVQSLRDIARTTPASAPWAARVYYAFADALDGAGSPEAAREWLVRAAEADVLAETDAAERLGGSREEIVDVSVADADDEGGRTSSSEAGHRA